MRRGSRLSALALVLLFALGLSACGSGGGSSTAGTTAPPSTGSQPAHPENAEESIEGFGSEAGGSQRQAILAAFHGYLRAIADRDYPSACSLLTQTVQRGMRQFVPAQLKGKGCAFLLSKLLTPSAATLSAQQAKGTITKVRVQGERAFVVFKAPGAKLYQLTMDDEGGWKAGTAVASVLVPELP